MITGNTSNAAQRTRGVHTPDPVQDVNAPPKTVTNVQRAEFFAVEFGDDAGRRRITCVMKFGDQLYMDPNGEAWASRLRRLPEDNWMHKQLSQKIDSAMQGSQVEAEPLPKTDAVDIMGDK